MMTPISLIMIQDSLDKDLQRKIRERELQRKIKERELHTQMNEEQNAGMDPDDSVCNNNGNDGTTIVETAETRLQSDNKRKK